MSGTARARLGDPGRSWRALRRFLDTSAAGAELTGVPPALDLFCGAGGVSVGLSLLGFDSVVGVDNDVDAISTREAAGYPTVARSLEVPYLPRQDYELVWASPPCTAYSAAGSRSGCLAADELVDAILRRDWAWGRDSQYDPEVWLLLSAMETILHVQPRAVVVENVVNAQPALEACASVLEAEGWHSEVRVLSAECFGVPQTRRRSFLLGGTSPGFASGLRPTHQTFDARVGRSRLHEPSQRLLPWVSQAEALDWDDDPDRYVGFPRSNDRGAGAFRKRDWRRAVFPAFSVTEKARSWRVRERDGSTRPLELSEASRLQSMPSSFEWFGSRTSAFRQCGNVVPPPLAAVVAGAAVGLDPT